MPDTLSRPHPGTPPGDDAATIAEILVASGQVESYVRGSLIALDENARLRREVERLKDLLARHAVSILLNKCTKR